MRRLREAVCLGGCFGGAVIMCSLNEQIGLIEFELGLGEGL